MPQFQYQGINKAGKKVNGSVEAGSDGDLRMILRSQGIRPTKINKGNVLNTDLGTMFRSGGSVSLEVLVGFTRQLQVLISSGIPIVQALEILLEQASDGTMRSTVAILKEKVSSGSYFWEALSGFPKIFPKLYIALIKAGEASGSIDQMLKRLSRYLEDADRLRKMLKSAMVYPIAVVSIGIGVITLMLVFVIPKFEELLATNGQTLPAPTQLVINMSHFMIHNIAYILGISGVCIYLLIQYAKSDEGRAMIDRTFYHVPLFGTIMQKGGVARFSRTMQTLLASGVNIIDAIDICKATIDNAVIEQAVSKMRADVESGKTLGVVIAKTGVFPKMAVQMISVGESTGNLDKMLEKVADFYEAEVENLIGGLTKLIEPLILVFLGTTVGGLMIAMYLPILKMAGS
ncbi:type II secretion system F family protein [Bdellovibrionota bacterium FG-1]